MSNENLPPELVLANFVTMRLKEEGLASSDTALMVCQKALDAIRPHVRKMLASAREEGRREGFEKMREMAADLVTREMGDDAAEVVDDIRAMRDGAGETGTGGDPMCRCGYRKSEHDARGQVIATTKRDGTPRARPSVACIGFREAP